MNIAGNVTLSGMQYYFLWKELKKSNVFVLYSKINLKDLAEYELSGEHQYAMLDSVSKLKSFTNENYVVEILEELKISGKAKVYSKFNTSLIVKILKYVSFAGSYKFTSENTITNDTKFFNGNFHKIFSAQDSNLEYRFEKINDVFSQIFISYSDFSLNLRQITNSIRLNNFHLSEIDNYKKKEINILTLNSVSFDKLCNVIDLSWYWNSETGELKKKYESIRTIADFEYKIMYQLYLKMKECSNKNEVVDVVLDTETTGLNIYNLDKDNPDRDHCVAIPISWEINTGYVIFTDMQHFDNIPTEYVVSRLAELFENFSGQRTITIYEPPAEYFSKHQSVKKFKEDLNADVSASKPVMSTMNLFGNDSKENDKEDVNPFIVSNNNPFLRSDSIDDLAVSNPYGIVSESLAAELNTYDRYENEEVVHDDLDELKVKAHKIKFTFLRSLLNLIGHNIIFDRKVFYQSKHKIYFDDDTLQMAFDLNPQTVRGSIALKGLTHRLLHHETPELSDILGKGNEDKYKYLSDRRVAEIYGCADGDYTLTMFKLLKNLMSEEMYQQYKKQDVPMLNILAISEYYGMRTIEKEIQNLSDETEKNLEILREFMYSYVGTYVAYINERNMLSVDLSTGKLTQEQYDKAVDNIRVSKHERYEFDVKASNIRHVMYDILGYKIYGWTPGEKSLPKTDKFVMKKLASQKRTDGGKTFGTMTEDLLVFGADRKKYDKYRELGLNNKADEMCLIKAKDFNSCKNPLAIVLLKYADLNKEYTSYFKPIKEKNLEGKIFNNYKMARIETRRIMNPGQTMKGRLKSNIRSYDDDYYLVDFDMAQVEYRVMISLAQYGAMIKKMNNPENDYHTETAATLFGLKPYRVSKKFRKTTKSVNFGIPYGLSEHSLCERIYGVVNEDTMFETMELLQTWYKSNQPVADMLNKHRKDALVEQNLSLEFRNFIDAWKKDENKNYVLDEDGNKVPIAVGMSKNKLGFYRTYNLDDLDNKKKASIERKAGNYPIQSFAAELFRIILIRFYERCEKEGIQDKVIWHMLIHDELLCSVHKSVHPFYIYKIIKEACMITMPGHTKYFVGINIGNTWGECKDDAREAPVLFVDRMVKRWDAGEFGTGPFWFDDPWEFIKPYREQYIQDRILEIVERLQPDIHEKPIDVPHLLETFQNYTVRAYVNDYKQNYKITNVYDDSDADENNRHMDEIWASKLETWALDVFGDGKELIDIDGNLKTLRRKNEMNIHKNSKTAQVFNETGLEVSEYKNRDLELTSDLEMDTELQVDVPSNLAVVKDDLDKTFLQENDLLNGADLSDFELELDKSDLTAGVLFEDELHQDNDFWEFNETDLKISYETEEEDDDEDYQKDEIEFNTDVNADNVAGFIKKEETTKFVKVLNNQVLITTKHYQITKRCKKYLSNYVSKTGLQIVFKEPNGLTRWEIVKKSVDFKKLDKWLIKANSLLD